LKNVYLKNKITNTAFAVSPSRLSLSLSLKKI